MRYEIKGTYRKQYKTKQNDTFDKIAFELYGNENIASYIIEANPEQSDTIVFGEGVYLYLPIIEQIEKSTLPTWKGGIENGL